MKDTHDIQQMNNANHMNSKMLNKSIDQPFSKFNRVNQWWLRYSGKSYRTAETAQFVGWMLFMTATAQPTFWKHQKKTDTTGRNTE